MTQKTVKKKTAGGVKKKTKTVAKQPPAQQAKAKPVALKQVTRVKSAPVRVFTKVVAPVSEPDEPPTVQQLRKVKTGLTKRDLETFHRLLLAKRAEILGDVESMETDARGKNAGGNLSNMPVHMADVGSDNYEQEFTLGLVESERKLLREIDDSLQRIKDGIYGVCLERGIPIARPRLEAKPWAKYCIEVARERERRGLY